MLSMTDLETAARLAREASRLVAVLPTEAKDTMLLDLAGLIELGRDEILRANALDLEAARSAGVAEAKIQRLALSEASVAQLAAGVRAVAALPDPVGQVTREQTVPSGLLVRKVRAPLGVVCMIYEARPGVTVDAFALCFKAGNACILKGGKEAARSNAVLAGIVQTALSRLDGLTTAERAVMEHAVTVVSALNREALLALLQLEQYIDLVIPRGGTELIRFVSEHSRIPTIQHYHGVCHVFVDESADLDVAERVCVTAKTSAPATCNAAECILVHAAVAAKFVPRVLGALQRAGVEVRADPAVLSLAGGGGSGVGVKPAEAGDFGREFLELVVAMAVVRDRADAIAHIHRFGSNHTEAIITTDEASADEFCRRVQSSCVLVNASTRFNDGFQLGLGAEIGISTSKLHAYGPMGLEELTTQRYVVRGTGQTR